MVLIAAGIGAVAKWFGSKRGDAGDDVQGDDPIVRAMFKAVNEGDLDGFKGFVADDCRVAINSIDIAREDNLTGGWDLWADGISDVRDSFPDVHWELYDELTGTDDDKDKIAIRLVSTVTVDGEAHEFEIACFGVVENKKLTEWHQVADLETYNRRRQETGEDALEQ